jgi:hypothetical protein
MSVEQFLFLLKTSDIREENGIGDGSTSGNINKNTLSLRRLEAATILFACCSLLVPADMKEAVTVYELALNLLTSFYKSRVSTPILPHPCACAKSISPETSLNTWLYVQSAAKAPTFLKIME